MEVKIEKLDHQGKGIAYVDNVVTFVSKSIPGDIVDINITKVKKNYKFGVLQKIIKASPMRKKAFCPYYNLCGGCDLQNLSYEDTLKYKIDRIKNNF